jgi:flagellar assembly protein FliH
LQQFLPQSESATRNSSSGPIEVFEYPASPDAPAPPIWNGWEDAEGTPEKTPEEEEKENGSNAVELSAEFEQRLAEETRRSFEAGRERGRRDEREAQAATREAAESQRIQQAGELIKSFAQERDRYLHAVEHEVVKLALDVAARILRREAQMDPLLLTGAVRVALGQLSGLTQARLLVPPGELDLWTRAMETMPGLPVRPTVTVKEGMQAGDCEIETNLGSVDLGVRTQLAEIERGFFDRVGGGKTDCPASDVAGPAGDGSRVAQESRA